MTKKILKLFYKLIYSPKEFLLTLISIVRGFSYILLFKLLKKNVKIKFPLLCHTKVEIKGPGKVSIDRYCAVWMNTFEHLVIHTLSPDAEVRIGKNCTLGGLTIRCYGKVIIGDNILTAGTLIQDVPIADEILRDGKNQVGEEKAINIGNDVWLAGQSLILNGSIVGDGSVLGMNALLYKSSVGNECLSNGNPAMRPIPIEKLNRLKKTENERNIR